MGKDRKILSRDFKGGKGRTSIRKLNPDITQ